MILYYLVVVSVLSLTFEGQRKEKGKGKNVELRYAVYRILRTPMNVTIVCHGRELILLISIRMKMGSRRRGREVNGKGTEILKEEATMCTYAYFPR